MALSRFERVILETFAALSRRVEDMRGEVGFRLGIEVRDVDDIPAIPHHTSRLQYTFIRFIEAVVLFELRLAAISRDYPQIKSLTPNPESLIP